MAAIPDAGGARFAPRVVMRALLRAVLLGGLVAVGWLLGSGISYADENPGQPGTNLIHLANTVSSDDGSGDVFTTPAAVVPTFEKVLSTAAEPRLPVQPPVQVSALRPIVKAVGIAKPLDRVLPVSGALPASTRHAAAALHIVPAQQVVAVPPVGQAAKSEATPTATPTIATKVAAPSPALTPAVHAPPVLCAPPQRTVEPVMVLPASGSVPLAPMPVNPGGSTASLCTIGAGGGGSSSKNGPDAAVHEGSVAEGFVASHGSHDRDTSGFPRSLAEQPSTSPD